MMPGESQSRTVPIASDATVGNCQNCSVLHQSLAEYVSSFLALKQKITVSDDSIRLQQQLEELQIRLVTLEKKTADYECVQAELQEKKSALKDCGRMAEEIERLKQENSNIIAQKNNLEDQLKDVKELTETQSLENAQLKREKAAVENDLLETQSSLKNCQARADQVEELMKENAKQTSIKESLEKKVTLLEESVCKQNSKISQLTKEKFLLERNIDDLQTRLMKLERERCKDYRSTSTQASVPEEPKVDKEKLRMLLESLWTCVEPQLHDSTNMLHLPVSEPNFKPCVPSSPPRLVLSQPSVAPLSHKISDPYSSPVKTKATHTQSNCSPHRPKAKTLQTTNIEKKSDRPEQSAQLFRENKTEESPADLDSSHVSIEMIMSLFRPLHPCLSPLPDREPNVEPMEPEVGEGNHSSEPYGDSVPLRKRESVVIKLPSDHCSQSSIPSIEVNADLPGVPAQEVEQISSPNHSRDLVRNELSVDTEMKDESCTDGEAAHAEGELQAEQNPASVLSLPACPSSASPTTSTALLPEVVPLTTEGQEQSCSMDLSTCEAESALETANPSETVTESDVKTSPRAITSAGAVSADEEGGESPSRSDLIVKSLVICSAVSSPRVDSVTNAEVTNTENDVEPRASQQDYCGLGESSQDVTSFKTLESTASISKDTHTSDNIPCLPGSTDSICSISSEIEAEKRQNDAAVKPLMEEGGNEAQEPTVVASVSPSGSNGGDGHLPPAESLVPEKEDAESHANQEADKANVRTPPQNHVEMEMLDSAVLAAPSDSQEAVDCDSSKENVHPACESSNSPFPSVKPQTLETQPSPKKLMIDVDTDLSAAENKPVQPLPDSEEVGAINEDLPVDSSEQEVSRCETDTATASVKQSDSSTEGHKTCLAPSKDGLENPQEPREDDCSPEAGSTKTQTPETLGVVRSEMGPPLPRILTPLSTPPKPGKSINPRQAIGKLLFPSPMETLASPTTPTQAQLTPGTQQLRSSSLSSPLPPSGVPSSPLQFGSATPKHAVPVPGRLPMAAMTSSPSSSSSPSQENSMRILDTMYPELSAHGRTLSILRGNLGICTSESGALPTAAVSQMSGFKTINSASTAFTKTEGKRGEKRQLPSLPQARSSKCLRLDSNSPSVSPKQVPSSSSDGAEEPTSSQPLSEAASSALDNAEPTERDRIASALRKIEHECFDLLPVIQSHLGVGNLPKKPVLRDEEKEVIAEICQSRIVDDMISTILDKLKAEKEELSTHFLQALCRVYTGLCRQTGAWEKARVLAYCILTQDFPDSAKLILFIATTWPGVLSHPGSMCQAIHTVTKLKAQENLLSCLSAFFGWDKSPPCDIDELLSRTLSEVRSGSDLSFFTHSRHGDDLGPRAWEHVFTLHILCAHKKWIWTYETIMGKQLWPIMNDWVTQPRNQQGPISDATVATVLRLIGRLGQVGLKERCVSSVETVAKVITTFCKHAQAEGVPWQVQLASVYCIHELSPWNPREALNVLAEWRGEMFDRVPPAVTSCINQLASVCRQASK